MIRTVKIPKICKVFREGVPFQTWKGSPLLPISFRPISILPALSKVWENTFKALVERCLGKRIAFYVNQYGFRKGRSTIETVSHVCRIVDTCRKKKQSYILRQGQAYMTSQTRRTILCDTGRRTFASKFTINGKSHEQNHIYHLQKKKEKKIKKGLKIPEIWYVTLININLRNRI